MLSFIRRTRERWRLVSPGKELEFQKRAAAADRILRETVQQHSPDSDVISFGPTDRPGGLIWVLAFQTEKDRLKIEHSEAVKRELREALVSAGYSDAIVEAIRFQFRSEERHKIFTWLNRW